MTARGTPQPARAQRMLLIMAALLALCHVAACMRTGKSMSTQLRGGGGGRALLQAMVEATTATFHDAPACLWRPSAGSSSPDAAGRLWGWESGQSCAFRSGAGRPLFYTGYEPGSWVLTPSCRSAPFAPDAVTDSRFKTWAWEGDKLCAYKDDQLQPVPFTKMPTRADWAIAFACTNPPTPATAAPDKLNRLWGWELFRNCPFKNAGGEPIYYDGYSGPRYKAPAPPLPPPPPMTTVASPAPAASPAAPAQQQPPAATAPGNTTAQAPDAPPCSANVTAEELARAIADRLWEKMAAATNGYESSTPLDLDAAAQDAADALVKAASSTDSPTDQVQAAQANDSPPEDEPAATPLEVAYGRSAPARYTDAQVEALVDAPAPKPAGDTAAVSAQAVEDAQAGIEAAGVDEASPAAAANSSVPRTNAVDQQGPVGDTAAAVLQALEAVVAAAEADKGTSTALTNNATQSSDSGSGSDSNSEEQTRPTPRMAAELLPGVDAVGAAVPAAAATPKIVGDTLSKPAATGSSLADQPSAAAPTLDAPASSTAGLAGNTVEVAQSLAELLTDGGPGGAAPPGTKGTGGVPTGAPLPPDAQFPAFGAASAPQVRRAPANPSLIREPTASYSPGGITPPGTLGSLGQLTLVPSAGAAAGDFGAASAADDAVDYVPIGPTSRGGHYARLVPGTRLLARPAERATIPTASSPSPQDANSADIGPGAAKEIVARLQPAAAARQPVRLLLESSPNTAAAPPQATTAPQVVTSAEADAASQSSSESLRVAGATSGAQSTSDGADASASARAAAFALEAHASNASASAAASSFVNRTNPDGSWSASWSNASSSSWSRTWNASWSSAQSEASASAQGGAGVRVGADAAAAAGSTTAGAAAAAAADAGADASSAGGGSAEHSQRHYRRLLTSGDDAASNSENNNNNDPWISAPRCAVAVGGPNTVSNITRDDYGRYWGFQAGASCAFRDVDISALKYAQRAPYDGPTFTAAPACPAGASNRTAAADGHVYGWDKAVRVTCTFDKPHPSRPALVPPAAAAAAAVTVPVPAAKAAPVPVVKPAPAKLATTSGALDRARRFPDGGGTASTAGAGTAAKDEGGGAATFAAAELPPELPPPTVAAGVASVAALTRAQAVASSIVAEAVNRASSLLRALDDQVQQVLSGESTNVADDNTGDAAAPAATNRPSDGVSPKPVSSSSPPAAAAAPASRSANATNTQTPAARGRGANATTGAPPPLPSSAPSPLVVVDRHWREIRRPNANDAGPDDDVTDADYAVDDGRYDYEPPTTSAGDNTTTPRIGS